MVVLVLLPRRGNAQGGVDSEGNTLATWEQRDESEEEDDLRLGFQSAKRLVKLLVLEVGVGTADGGDRRDDGDGAG